MPIYVYACEGCEHAFEEFQSMSSEPLSKCPECKKPKLHRVPTLPNLKTNSTFLAGAKYGAEQFAGGDPRAREQYLAPAREAGVSINGKIYQHGLARFPGDPRAWVSSRDEVKKRVQEMGGECEELGVKAEPQAPKKSVPIGEDILNREVRDLLKAGVITKKQAVKERGEIADSITAHYKKGTYSKPKKRAKK